MNELNPSNSPVNFTAKLGISDIKTNVRRWRNISQIFENQTKNYPNDTFEIIKSGVNDYNLVYTEDLLGFSFCKITKEQLKKLLNSTDEKIAEKFTKLFALYKFQLKKIALGREFLNKIQQNGKTQDNEFTNGFFTLLINKCSRDFQNAVNSDKSLKTFHKEIG